MRKIMLCTLMAMLLMAVKAGKRMQLHPEPKTNFREHETHQLHHPIVGDAANRVTVTNYQDLQYYGQLRFGSNSQAVKMIFDPASTICWLPTILCDTS